MPVLAAIAGGLCAGSFLNVVAYRLPRGQSLVRPGSHCPRCGEAVKPYDNIPLVGWLLLRGRCRACRKPISARYPLIEALTALLAVSVVVVKHSPRDIALGLLLVAVLVPIALIDLDRRIIPNRLTLPAGLSALALGIVLEPAKVPEQLISGAAASGFLLVFVLAYPRGMGMGDVKLAGVLGLFLGRSVAPALFVAVLAGTLVGIVQMSHVGLQRGRKLAIPFGPFLAMGGVAGLLAGPAIVHWYLHAAG